MESLQRQRLLEDEQRRDSRAERDRINSALDQETLKDNELKRRRVQHNLREEELANEHLRDRERNLDRIALIKTTNQPKMLQLTLQRGNGNNDEEVL